MRAMRRLTRLTLGLIVASMLAAPAVIRAALTGAIFTTDSTCTGIDLNIYGDKSAVYLDGGPAHSGSGLPDGVYYVQVTEPNGTLLGSSGNATPISVSGGQFDHCYQLASILFTASSNGAVIGYDTTSNSGGEYKVWVSKVSTFDNDSTKTDNFKVKDTTGPPPEAHLKIHKFYDANANGSWDGSEPELSGWKITIKDSINLIRFTPVDITVDPDTYLISESAPLELNWYATVLPFLAEKVATVDAGETFEFSFGNVCVGPGGGLTLGFWSNKNGQALIGTTDITMLLGLNLKDGLGVDFDPATNTAVRTWLLNGTAVNMAYMLSVQLAAMELNVFNGFVNGASLVYAPGAVSANSLGFVTVSALMAEANSALNANPLTLSGSPARAYQEALKNALDRANNNLTFVQANPCPFSF